MGRHIITAWFASNSFFETRSSIIIIFISLHLFHPPPLSTSSSQLWSLACCESWSRPDRCWRHSHSVPGPYHTAGWLGMRARRSISHCTWRSSDSSRSTGSSRCPCSNMTLRSASRIGLGVFKLKDSNKKPTDANNYNNILKINMHFEMIHSFNQSNCSLNPSISQTHPVNQ